MGLTLELLSMNPAGQVTAQVVRRNATAEHAVELIQRTAVREAGSRAVRELLQRHPFQPRRSWFRAIFDEIDRRTTYQYDAPGKEQIKTPDVLLYTGRGDCDDYSTLWTALLNAVGVQSSLKIVDYEPDGNWDHIYVMVPYQPAAGGPDQYLVLDNVYGKHGGLFGQEVPYRRMKKFIKT